MSEDKPKPKPGELVLANLIDEFLGWVDTNLAADTYLWYQSRLQVFCKKYPDLLVSALKPHHVQTWIDGMKVAKRTKRNFARSIMRCMNWAKELGYIEVSPLAHFKKPRGGVRQTFLTPDEYQGVLGAIRSQQFRDLCVFAWETGARAMECLALEARHLELQNCRVVFPVDEEKMEREPRVIYLTETSMAIVERLSKDHPEGKLFRNTNGKPWTTEAVNCAFVALQIRMGNQKLTAENYTPDDAAIKQKTNSLKPTRKASGKTVPKSPQDLREESIKKLRYAAAVKKAPKYCLTALRHSFCHRLLKSGVDAITVSNLMGHAGVSMVVESVSLHATRFYSSSDSSPKYDSAIGSPSPSISLPRKKLCGTWTP